LEISAFDRFGGNGTEGSAGNSSRIAYRFTTLSRSELTPYYAAFYGGGVKSIPELELTPLALAVWFMDDGSKSYRAVYLNTQQFDVASQERLKVQLMSQFWIRVTLNRDKTYYRLRMAVESVARFRRLIEPHLLEEFAYKLPA
jgi:LAGLIDADG DNA endonuclease family